MLHKQPMSLHLVKIGRWNFDTYLALSHVETLYVVVHSMFQRAGEQSIRLTSSRIRLLAPLASDSIFTPVGESVEQWEIAISHSHAFLLSFFVSLFLIHRYRLTATLSWCPSRSRTLNTSSPLCRDRTTKLSRTIVGPMSSFVIPARSLRRQNSDSIPFSVSAWPVSERKSGVSLTPFCSTLARLPFNRCCST